MKSNKELFTLSRLAAAVLATCMAPSLSFAQEESADALTRPTSTIEVGIGAPSQSSAKFGEYNGLNKADGGIVGNANIRGGDAYGMGTGTQRWEIKASDLGTTSREVGANYSDQGQWNIGLNYDELRHNLSDSYQTPYVGAAGSNNFTLPGFGLASNTTTLSAAQLAAYQNLNIDTTRKNTSLNAGMEINSRLGLKFDYNHLDQTGSKLMAFGSAGFAPTGVTASSGEAVSILPNPTNYQTDTVNLAVNWTGDSANLTASYFGSFFRDGYDRVKQGLNPRAGLGHGCHDAIDQEGRIGLDDGQGRARSIGQFDRLAIEARGGAVIGFCRLPKPLGYAGQGLGTHGPKLVWCGVGADLTDKISFLAATGAIGQGQVLTI